jgi:hypothetical protein
VCDLPYLLLPKFISWAKNNPNFTLKVENIDRALCCGQVLQKIISLDFINITLNGTIQRSVLRNWLIPELRKGQTKEQVWFQRDGTINFRHFLNDIFPLLRLAIGPATHVTT